MQESILVYRNLRYLKWAAALTAVCTIAYLLHPTAGVSNGGTWLGYTLGTIAAAIMIWLCWLAVKKRQYGTGKMPVQDWLSAHVYFGIALMVIATLHAGFRLGANIHSVLYVVMLVAILSGMVGVYGYMRYPAMLTANRRGLSAEVMISQIVDLDREMRQLAMGMDDATNTMALRAAQETVVGGTWWQQLRGYDEQCATSTARAFVEQSGDDAEAPAGQADDNRRRQLLTRLVRKEDLLKRIRRDVQLRMLLRIWLYVHVPFSIAAFAALIAHIIAEFYYW